VSVPDDLGRYSPGSHGRQDVDNSKRHVLFGLQENLTLSQRITKLEEEIRKRP
jgi:hypothetical protein